jgi:hypothetical protein
MHAGMTAARYRLYSAPEDVLSEQQIKMGYFFAALLHASFSKALGRLLDMPDSTVTVEMVNAATNTSVPLSCNNVPSKAQLPLVFSEWCVPLPGQERTTADEGDVERNCGDPYAAYVQWCAPAVCHTLGPKSPYLQVRCASGMMCSVHSTVLVQCLARQADFAQCPVCAGAVSVACQLHADFRACQVQSYQQCLLVVGDTKGFMPTR